MEAGSTASMKEGLIIPGKERFMGENQMIPAAVKEGRILGKGRIMEGLKESQMKAVKEGIIQEKGSMAITGEGLGESQSLFSNFLSLVTT